MIAEPIKTTLLVHELESWEFCSKKTFRSCKFVRLLPLNESVFGASAAMAVESIAA
jgi:hypothetical protein